MDFFDYYNRIKGHLTIHKVWVNGDEELVYDSDNVITSGMSYSLSHLFAGSGSNSILDHQIERFQIGTSGSSALQVSSTFQLSGALTTAAQYGVDSRLILKTAEQFKNGSVTTALFALIPFSKITRINETMVRYTMVLDEQAANGLTLNEIGLFTKNPRGLATDQSVLVAYRSFSNITKTNEWSLVMRWTLSL